MKGIRLHLTMRCIFLMLFALGSTRATAQDCNNPQLICGEAPTAIGLSNLQPVTYECMNAPYTLFLHFTTNLNTSFTGSVNLHFDAMNCGTDGVPDIIQAIIVKPNQQDFCNDLAYTPVSPCLDVTGPTTLSTVGLTPNTDYLIILGTAHEPTNSPCSMTLSLTGSAIGINACCTANLAQGQSAEISVVGGDPALGYVWSPEYYITPTTGEQVTVSPLNTTTYTVSGFIGACAYSDAVTVTVGNPLDIPNSFTPNDDGFNDFWSIPDLIPYDRARLLIYDRWGQVVYRSTGYPKPWDGNRNGKAVPEGAYYYTIDLNDEGLNLPTITGSITLVR
jgi:gliding motility-associated-like protein